MDVFAFAVHKFADVAGLIALPHFAGRVEKAVVFRVLIDFPRRFDRFNQFNGFGKVGARQHLAHHMASALHEADGAGRMLVRIVRQHRGVHIGLNELFKIFKEFHADACFVCRLPS